MYKHILVPLDGSPTGALALKEAASLAKLCGATLHLLHIVDSMQHITGFEPPMVHITDVRPRFMQAGQDVLDEACQKLAEHGVAVTPLLLENPGARVAELIVDNAQRLGVDLIVMGTHGRRGVNRLLLGSDAEQTVRLAGVPVLLVRAREESVPDEEAS